MKIIGSLLLVLIVALLTWIAVKPSAPAVELQIQNYVLATYGVMKLQVVEEVTLEKIERREKDSIFWNMIRLPDIVVEVRVPVVTTYYVDLEKGFKVQQTDGNWIFTVPELQFNSPAADISAIDYRVREGQFYQSTDEAIKNLQSTLTPLLIQRAEQATVRLKPKAEEKLREFLIAWATVQGQKPPKSVQIQWAPFVINN